MNSQENLSEVLSRGNQEEERQPWQPPTLEILKVSETENGVSNPSADGTSGFS